MNNWIRISKSVLIDVFSVFAKSGALVFVLIIFGGLLVLSYTRGYSKGFTDADSQYASYLRAQAEMQASSISTVSATPTVTKIPAKSVQKISWGGPELWLAVNKRRQELGVNPINQKDELCTIASIRLNELLELGKLDGHEGFSTMKDRRPDLKDIFENYSNVSEFLAYGGDTPGETVSLWENTLAHKKLLTGGEYVWGCIYAQNTFAVAITAY